MGDRHNKNAVLGKSPLQEDSWSWARAQSKLSSKIKKSKKLASIGDDLYNPMAVNLKTFAYAMVS